MLLIDTCAHTNRLSTRPGAEKLVLSLGMLLLALLLPPVPGCAAITALMVWAAIGWAAIPAGAYLQVALTPLGFLLAGTLPLLATVSLPAGRLHLAWAPGGAAVAGRVALHSLAGMSCILLLALTTPIPRLLMALRWCGVPAPVVEMAMLVYRFLFAFLETLRLMRIAQASRLGYGSAPQTIRSLGLLAGSFFVRVFERARCMEQGLAARGWDGEMRVLSDEEPFSLASVVLVLGAQTAIALALLWWGRILQCPI